MYIKFHACRVELIRCSQKQFCLVLERLQCARSDASFAMVISQHVHLAPYIVCIQPHFELPEKLEELTAVSVRLICVHEHALMKALSRHVAPALALTLL